MPSALHRTLAHCLKPFGGAALLLLLLDPPVAAQEPAPRVRSPWSGTVQLNGSAFFGTSDQRVIGAKGSLSRRDSTVELGTSAQVVYGDAKLAGDDREVTKRTLLGTLSADLRPHASLSPFVLFTLETNLEKKIDGRYSISIGARQTLVRTEQTETSLSAAILDEFTVPFAIAEPLPSTRLTRWSFRGRVRHEFDDRLRASHATFWMPSARTTARYLVRSTSEAQYALTSIVNLTTSVHVNYDSEAMARGARVNHDGQVLVGVGARW